MPPDQMKLQIISKEDLGEKMKRVLEADLPVMYANAFIVFLGQADIGLVLQTNGKETCILNMSYSTAKTLVEQLGNTLRNFEEKTGNPIMSSTFIQKKMGMVPNATS